MSAHAKPDLRKHPRSAVSVALLVGDARRRAHGSVRLDTRDLSIGGAFVRTSLFLEVGEELAVELPLPGGGNLKSRARVARVDASPNGPGMGLAFVELSEADQAQVQALLAAPLERSASTA